MSRRRGLTIPLVLACALSLHLGCGDAHQGRKEISGTIKLKGALLDQGSIEFMPLYSAKLVTKGSAGIQDGAYRLPRDHGLVPGKYKVIITSGDGRTPAMPDGVPGPTGANIVSKDRIPPQYNVASKQEVEVTEKGPNVFSYDIP